ncbi:hypothetical protein [Nocardia sp. NPDC003963]
MQNEDSKLLAGISATHQAGTEPCAQDTSGVVGAGDIFPELVLLVETQSMRSTAAARLGDEDGLALLTTRVQKARDQIDTTADRIPGLEQIPTDRPVRGLVVTLEPIPLVDTFLFEDLLGPHTVPNATVCAHDLEAILPTLAKTPDAGRRLLDALTFRDPTPPALERAVAEIDSERNPISAMLVGPMEGDTAPHCVKAIASFEKNEPEGRERASKTLGPPELPQAGRYTTARGERRARRGLATRDELCGARFSSPPGHG